MSKNLKKYMEALLWAVALVQTIDEFIDKNPVPKL